MNELSISPEARKDLEEIKAYITDYRFLVCGNYLAFYRYKDATVYVDRILYGRRDYLKILFPEFVNHDDEDI